MWESSRGEEAIVWLIKEERPDPDVVRNIIIIKDAPRSPPLDFLKPFLKRNPPQGRYFRRIKIQNKKMKKKTVKSIKNNLVFPLFFINTFFFSIFFLPKKRVEIARRPPK